MASNYSALLIVFMSVIIIALFILMIWAAIGAGKATDKSTCPDAPNKCQTACHKYSTMSAVGCGIIVGLTIIALIIYLYTNKKLIHSDIKATGQQFGQGIQQFGQNVQSYSQ